MKFRLIYFSILVGFMFFLGFSREFVFENINTHLQHLQLQNGFENLPGPLWVFRSFSYQELYYTKFILVLLFAILFWVTASLAVWVFFKNRRFVVFTFYFFVLIFALSMTIFLIGKFLGVSAHAYAVSRYLIEFIQSPLSVFLLVPGLKLWDVAEIDKD